MIYLQPRTSVRLISTSNCDIEMITIHEYMWWEKKNCTSKQLIPYKSYSKSEQKSPDPCTDSYHIGGLWMGGWNVCGKARCPWRSRFSCGWVSRIESNWVWHWGDEMERKYQLYGVWEAWNNKSYPLRLRNGQTDLGRPKGCLWMDKTPHKPTIFQWLLVTARGQVL